MWVYHPTTETDNYSPWRQAIGFVVWASLDEALAVVQKVWFWLGFKLLHWRYPFGRLYHWGAFSSPWKWEEQTNTYTSSSAQHIANFK